MTETSILILIRAFWIEKESSISTNKNEKNITLISGTIIVKYNENAKSFV